MSGKTILNFLRNVNSCCGMKSFDTFRSSTVGSIFPPVFVNTTNFFFEVKLFLTIFLPSRIYYSHNYCEFVAKNSSERRPELFVQKERKKEKWREREFPREWKKSTRFRNTFRETRMKSLTFLLESIISSAMDFTRLCTIFSSHGEIGRSLRRNLDRVERTASEFIDN